MSPIFFTQNTTYDLELAEKQNDLKGSEPT